MPTINGRFKAAMETTATVAVIVGAAALLWNIAGRPGFAGPSCARRMLDVGGAVLGLDDVALRGSPGAQVGMVIFSDFQCPFCRRFTEETLPELEQRYVATNRLQVAFHHLPLVRIHPSAMKAAEAAECARRRDRFWPMHDLLFANPEALDDASLAEHAAAIGIDRSAFRSCLAQPPTNSVKRGQAEATALKVTSTPSFVFGVIRADGRLEATTGFAGARGLSEFTEVIDTLLRRGR